MSKYLKAGGYIGLAVGGAGSAVKISAVCQEGNTKACKKVKVTEAGNFSGGFAGGWLGAQTGGLVAAQVCLATGPGALVCGVAITGVGALAGSVGGMAGGEKLSELIFEAFQDD